MSRFCHFCRYCASCVTDAKYIHAGTATSEPVDEQFRRESVDFASKILEIDPEHFTSTENSGNRQTQIDGEKAKKTDDNADESMKIINDIYRSRVVDAADLTGDKDRVKSESGDKLMFLNKHGYECGENVLKPAEIKRETLKLNFGLVGKSQKNPVETDADEPWPQLTGTITKGQSKPDIDYVKMLFSRNIYHDPDFYRVNCKRAANLISTMVAAVRTRKRSPSYAVAVQNQSRAADDRVRAWLDSVPYREAGKRSIASNPEVRPISKSLVTLMLGAKPIVHEYEEDRDEIKVTVTASGGPADGGTADANSFSTTLRTLKRLGLIRDAIKSDRLVRDSFGLMRAIQRAESSEGYRASIDKKTLHRMYCRLVGSGEARAFHVLIQRKERRVAKVWLGEPSLGVDDPLVRAGVEQLKYKCFNAMWRKMKDNSAPKARPVREERAETAPVPARLADNYGYAKKFMRLQLFHEYLHFVAYADAPARQVDDVAAFLYESGIIVSNELVIAF